MPPRWAKSATPLVDPFMPLQIEYATVSAMSQMAWMGSTPQM